MDFVVHTETAEGFVQVFHPSARTLTDGTERTTAKRSRDNPALETFVNLHGDLVKANSDDI